VSFPLRSPSPLSTAPRICLVLLLLLHSTTTDHTCPLRPSCEHTELEEELHEKANLDYDRVAIVRLLHHTTRGNQTKLTLNSQVPNPSVAALYEDALVYETGSAITSSGALTAYSGKKTGRSPLDKRIVKEPSSENEIWWGPVNKPMTPEVRETAISTLSTCLHCHHTHIPYPKSSIWPIRARLCPLSLHLS
jgi:hypothetical protein